MMLARSGFSVGMHILKHSFLAFSFPRPSFQAHDRVSTAKDNITIVTEWTAIPRTCSSRVAKTDKTELDGPCVELHGFLRC